MLQSNLFLCSYAFALDVYPGMNGWVKGVYSKTLHWSTMDLEIRQALAIEKG